MRCYVAGKMRGKPNYGFQAFEDAASDLRQWYGWDVVSPHEQDLLMHRVNATWHRDGSRRVFDSVILSDDFDFNTVIQEDLDLIEHECDCIVLLSGWSTSEGACTELDHAMSLDYPVWIYDCGILTRLDGMQDAILGS